VVHGHDIESDAGERLHRTITRAAPKGSGGYTPAEHEEHHLTVAAVILAASPASALADAAGTPAARRLADVAWAGGATPVVVCSFDPDGTVAASLANAEVTLANPAAPEGGPVGQIVNGVEAAMHLVTDTRAALVWPARRAWVDAETVTTLIAAHGEDRFTVVRPAYRGEPGFPVLLPVAHLGVFRSLAADRMPDDLFTDLEALGIPFRIVDTGDPGVVLDVSVARDDLPPYDGPPEPAETPEWGSAVADQPDDAPVAGPNRLEPTP
jgi:CTP:molybdopterin cytidylyltransferase MocA